MVLTDRRRRVPNDQFVIYRTTESQQFYEIEHFRNRDFSVVANLATDVGVVMQYGIGAGICTIGNLFWAAGQASLEQNRELELHEVYEIIAACVLPFFGRALVHRFFYEHPEFDEMARTMYQRYTYEVQMMTHMH